MTAAHIKRGKATNQSYLCRYHALFQSGRGINAMSTALNTVLRNIATAAYDYEAGGIIVKLELE